MGREEEKKREQVIRVCPGNYVEPASSCLRRGLGKETIAAAHML